MTDTVDAIVIARALGDTTRARIVALLQRRDLCVCELTETLGQSQANISGHLKLLVSSGLVTSNRRSYWTHYALASNCRQISPTSSAPSCCRRLHSILETCLHW